MNSTEFDEIDDLDKVDEYGKRILDPDSDDDGLDDEMIELQKKFTDDDESIGLEDFENKQDSDENLSDSGEFYNHILL